MVGDLHIHSRYSDGARTVAEILFLTKERGLSYLSIVDQNTTAGTAEAIETGARIGVTVVPGVEISAHHSATHLQVHILGYGYRLPAASINELCKSISDGPPAEGIPDAEDAIRAIHADGGLAVLAHPGQLDSYPAVEDLVRAGLDGIELYHPDHHPDDHQRIQALAEQHGLFLTGGSDGGGRHGGNHEIGEIRSPFGSLAHLIRHEDELVAWTESLVREAGAMARRAVLTEIDAELKGGNIRDIVTEHDRAIDRFLTDSIHRRFPDHGFVTEEHDHPPLAEDTPAWIIDPIDGTTNFVSTHNYFAVCVAHYRGSEPVFGFVYDVMADELYLGIAGGGAWLNGRPLHIRPKPIHEAVVEASLICSRRLEERYEADLRPLVRDLRAQRSYGSAALGICRIAAGTLDMYISCSLSLWDYAAAIIVLSEAGGRAAIERRWDSTAADSGASRSPILEPVPQAILYHDDKRLFMAAAGESLLSEVATLLFTGPTRPGLALLAKSG